MLLINAQYVLMKFMFEEGYILLQLFLVCDVIAKAEIMA